jgi:hypothetical protein
MPAALYRWRPGGATLYWQQQALQSLDAALQARYGPGAAIVYKRGPYVTALTEVRVGPSCCCSGRSAPDSGMCALQPNRQRVTSAAASPISCGVCPPAMAFALDICCPRLPPCACFVLPCT